MFAVAASLEAAEADDRFTINMDHFGYYDPDVQMCFGCAATAYMVHHQGVDPSDHYPHHPHPSILTYATSGLEDAIDSLREGSPTFFLEYWGLICVANDDLNEWMIRWEDQWSMTNENFLDYLPRLREAAEELKQLGY